MAYQGLATAIKKATAALKLLFGSLWLLALAIFNNGGLFAPSAVQGESDHNGFRVGFGFGLLPTPGAEKETILVCVGSDHAAALSSFFSVAAFRQSQISTGSRCAPHSGQVLYNNCHLLWLVLGFIIGGGGGIVGDHLRFLLPVSPVRLCNLLFVLGSPFPPVLSAGLLSLFAQFHVFTVPFCTSCA